MTIASIQATSPWRSFSRRVLCTPQAVVILLSAAASSMAAPAGPTPQVPEGGAAPGAFPNTSVSAVNVVAKGGATYDGTVDVSGLEGNGPIPWTVNRYNRGDFALRLAPGNPAASLENLGRGAIEFGDNSPGVAASQAWRPSPEFGVVIPTARENGPIDWQDGEGGFFPTVGISPASSGPGYSMQDGAFGSGNLDINTGKAGPGSEGNFSFSATWFPYDQGWLGGDAAGPTAEGASGWSSPGARATGLAAGMVRWLQFPEESGVYGGVAEVRLPGVNSLEDGMLFATSSDGGSDVNIVGVAPREGGAGWVVTIREDSESDPEVLVGSGQSRFQFVYVPFDAQRLVGGHIVGADGSKRKAAGEFTVSRTGTGTYELTLPGKTAASGTLLLQAADFEAGTSVPLASRAFLSYEFSNGKFVIQSRKTTGSAAELADASFYVVWVDFQQPLAPPDGPRFRSRAPVVVSGEGVVAKEAGIAASTDAPEILVTSVDSTNPAGLVDPLTQQVAAVALVGRFHDAASLAPIGEPFVILGTPSGNLNRTDVKYNPVSKQYVVVANARGYSAAGADVALVALVNSPAAGGGAPLAKSWVHDPDTDQSYDDVAVAVSSRNGNFLMVAERKFAEQGEGTVGALYAKDGTRLTPPMTRLDVVQAQGDEDDPDVIYHAPLDAFLYLSNTDDSDGATGPFDNRVVGAVVDAVPDSQGRLVVRAEQALGDGEPVGTPEGHPASMVSPFTGELLTAYDWGNGTPNGDLSFVNIGPAPTYTFTQARAEVPYLRGSAGTPFKHQHPQLAADPAAGVILVGMNATGSDAGLPEGYAFVALGPDGQPLPSQLKAPYYLADAPGGLGTTVNFHNVTYSAPAGVFLAAFTSNPGVTYLTSLRVTSSHLVTATPPSLTVTRGATGLSLSWPADAAGYDLQSTATLVPPAWRASGLTPVVDGAVKKVTVNPADEGQLYRLAKP